MQCRLLKYLIHELFKITKHIKFFFLATIFITSCSSVDYQQAGQYDYLSCKNIAKASQDIFKRYPSIGKDEIKLSAKILKNIRGGVDSVELTAAKKNLEALSTSAKLKGCPK